MNKLFEKIAVGAGIVALVCGSFTVGTLADGIGWQDKAVSKANHDIYVAGENKKNELIGNIDQVIEDKMLDAAETKIDTKEQTVEQALDDYFTQKVESMNGTEVNQIDGDLNIITDGVIDRFENEIDKAFEGR